ncbi:hypothetical protein ABBQ38_013381 [Trebouxia sp. C0009 RCD-2024]
MFTYGAQAAQLLAAIGINGLPAIYQGCWPVEGALQGPPSDRRMPQTNPWCATLSVFQLKAQSSIRLFRAVTWLRHLIYEVVTESWPSLRRCRTPSHMQAGPLLNTACIAELVEALEFLQSRAFAWCGRHKDDSLPGSSGRPGTHPSSVATPECYYSAVR